MERVKKSTRIKNGDVFGRLTAIQDIEFAAQKVLCLCECGSTKYVIGKNLLSGASRSCGCRVSTSAKERMTTHGKSRTPEHNSWQNAKARCTRKSHPRYDEWGGRGIRMCDRWLESFDAFLQDMGPRPGPGYSLDRIDGSKGYEPGNCRWATSQQQSENRPAFVNEIEFRGEKMNITKWAKRVGISRKSLYGRIESGWSLEEALTLPKGARKAVDEIR